MQWYDDQFERAETPKACSWFGLAKATAIAVCCLCLFNACTGLQGPKTEAQTKSFPLHRCTDPNIEPGNEECIRGLFAETDTPQPEAVLTRDTRKFPTRYLELWNADVRAKECQRLTSYQRFRCEEQLTELARYFNPDLKAPTEEMLGVALEGGGSKSAPFSLGVLAGLQETEYLHQRKVGTIASVSGGSYAAHFLFNRYLDQVGTKNSSDERDWFRSCIPDHFAQDPNSGMFELSNHYKNSLKNPQQYPSCGDLKKNREYRYQTHVWTHPDVLKEYGGTDERAQNANLFRRDEVVNFAGLMGKSILSDFVSIPLRDVLRQPINYSPTRKVYQSGIERQFGYSPDDWDQFYDPQNPFKSALNGRKIRTLKDIGNLPNELPKWVIAASTPGWITGTDWLHASATDPVRHQFELSAQGHGSGITGYIKVPPEGPPTLGTPYTEEMSIIDAVVSSAAFFDDNQQLFGKEPLRFFMALAQTALNLEWFTEIRNFNASDAARQVQNGLPWPLYLSSTSQVHAPYIHLQDGGNSEGAALLPVLRRGYKKIVWAHGTTDAKAEFSSLCHLKNQLEVDGWYFIRSPDLESVVKDIYGADVPKKFQRGDGSWSPEFKSYLDYLCTIALDDGDFKAIDDNPHIDTKGRKFVFNNDDTPSFKRLLCARLGLLDQTSNGESRKSTSDLADCDALYREKVDVPSYPRINPSFSRWPFLEDLFFRMKGRPLRFLVFKTSQQYAYQNGRMPDIEEPGTEALSVIYALVPSLAWDEVKDHVKAIPDKDAVGEGLPQTKKYKSWGDYCASKDAGKVNWSITSCLAPENVGLVLPDVGTAPSLSCNALAYVLKYEDKCRDTYSSTPPSLTPSKRPDFPQDNFVFQTLHSGYVKFSAYFDLARQGVWNSKCELSKPWHEAMTSAWLGEPICKTPPKTSTFINIHS